MSDVAVIRSREKKRLRLNSDHSRDESAVGPANARRHLIGRLRIATIWEQSV